jgi:hypothetical protein
MLASRRVCSCRRTRDAATTSHQRHQSAVGEGDNGEVGYGPRNRSFGCRCGKGLCGRCRKAHSRRHPRPSPFALSAAGCSACVGAYATLAEPVRHHAACFRPFHLADVPAPLRAAAAAILAPSRSSNAGSTAPVRNLSRATFSALAAASTMRLSCTSRPSSIARRIGALL